MFLLCGSHVHHGERSHLVDIGLALLAIGGITVMVAGGASSLVTSPTGDLLAAGTLTLGAFYVLASKKARIQFSAPEYMMGITLAGAIAITPVALLGASDLGEITWQDLGWLAVIVFLVGTIAGYFILNESITTIQLVGIAIAVGALVLVVRRTTA